MPEPLKTGLLLVLILAAGLYMAACGCKPRVVRPPPAAADSQAPPRTVYVANHGWHTGVIIPGSQINREIPALEDRFGDVPYYEFGWGDARFYQAGEISFRLGIRALCWPTDAVLHVVALPSDPKRCFPHSEVAPLVITKEGFDSLRTFINSSFTRDSQGLPQTLGRGIYGNSRFYRAEGTFFLTNTCNKWTAKALRSAGRDIPVTFSFSAGSIMNHLRRTVPTPAR